MNCRGQKMFSWRTTALVVVGALVFSTVVDTLHILIMSPSLTKSIVQSSGRMADVLVRAGHDVTFWIPEMHSKNNINGTRLARIVRTNGYSNSFETLIEGAVDYFDESSNFIALRQMEFSTLVDFCESILKRRHELDRLFGSKKFDIAFSTMIDVCWPGIAAYLRIPRFSWISTGPYIDWYTLMLGNSQSPSYIPSTLDNIYSTHMNFYQRTLNAATYAINYAIWHKIVNEETALFRRLISQDFENMDALARRSTISVGFAHLFLDHVRPMPYAMTQYGLIGLPTPKSVIEAAMIFVNDVLGAETARQVKNIVLFSLGSAVPTQLINQCSMKAILESFRSLPDYFFFVKISEQDKYSRQLAANISNVRVFTWLPQYELLGHPQMRLFITHGGFNSYAEASMHGVPMIGIPVFFDQYYNVELAVKHGCALRLHRSLVTKDSLRAAILQITENIQYKKRAHKLSKLIETHMNWRDPSDYIVKRIEFFARHVGNHGSLQVAANMNTFIYHCLDAFVLPLVLVALLTTS